MEQEKKDYLQLFSPDKSGTAFGKWLVISHCALCTKPRLIDLLHKLNAFINNEHSSGTLLPLLHLTPLFLHFWNPGSSKAGKSSWWVGHYCRLTLQHNHHTQHTIHSTEKKKRFQRHCYHDCPVTILGLIQERSYLNENSKGVDIGKKCYWWDRELRREKKYGFSPYVVSHSSFSIYSPPLHLIPTWLALFLLLLFSVYLTYHCLTPFFFLFPLKNISWCSYKVPAMKAFIVTSKV